MTWTISKIAYVQFWMHHFAQNGQPVPDRFQRIEDYLFRRLEREENPS